MGKKDLLSEEIKPEISKEALFLKTIAHLCSSTFLESGVLFDEITKSVGSLVGARMVSISEIRGKELYFSHLFFDGVVTQDAGHCPLDVTPCATVKEQKKVLCYSDVQKKFPRAEMLKNCDAYYYCGIPCMDSSKNVTAVLCIINDREKGFEDDDIDLITVLGSRIGMERECQRHLEQQALAEVEIREREKKYRTLIQTANDAIFTADTKVGIILEANHKAAELTGYPVSELVGKHFTELHPLEDGARYEQVFREAVRKGSIIAGDLFLLHKSGKKVPVEVSTNVFELNGNEVIQGIFRDLTERKKAEEELRIYQEHLEELVEERTAELSNTNARLNEEAEERRRFEAELAVREQSYRTLANNIPGIVFRLNMKDNYRMTFFNDMVRQLTGFEGNELKGHRCNAVHTLILLDDRSNVAETIKQALENKEPYEVEYRILCRRKEVRHLVERGRPVFDGNEVCCIDGIILENTRQKQVEEELRSSEARLMEAQKTGKIGSWEWDIERDTVFRSPENYRLFGFDPEEASNITYADFMDRIHPDDRERIERAIEQCKRRKKDFKAEYRIVLPDGDVRNICSHATWLRNETGRVCLMSGVVQDLTEMKRFETELKTFRAAVDHSDDCTFLIDPKSMLFIDFNRQAVRKLGYSKKELLTMGPQHLNAIHDKEQIKATYERLPKRKSTSKKIETLYRRKNGTTFLVEVSLSKLKLANDKELVIADARDITARLVAERAVKESEERYRLFAENFKGIAFQGQLGGSMLFLHGDVKAITGYAARDLFAGKPRWDQMYHPDDREAFLKGYKELRSIPKFSVEREYRIVTKGGAVRWVEEVVSNVCDDSGKPVKVQGAIFDITERKKAEESLKIARQAAEDANRAKSRLMANINHEIRSPMQAVMGMTEMLKETELTEAQADYMETISAAGENILRLVNNVLDFSKIESGGFEIEVIDFELCDVVRQSMNMVSFQARKKGLRLDCRQDEVTSKLKGDPVRLQQVLTNLLVNAVKFTKEGKVVLKVVKKRETPKTLGLEFSVTDTGIGISPEKLPLIFDSYVQSDRSIARLFGGTGLGTTISRQLVELMGGRIWAKSREGKGSVFTFELSFRKGRASKKAKSKKAVAANLMPVLQPLNVLLVEDSPDIQMLVRLFFEKTAICLDVAEDGLAGVEAFKAKDYDMVLLDIEMPLMDGVTACRKIRKWEISKGRDPVPIIALTGNAYGDDSTECSGAGFDNHILKPMKMEELFEMVNKYGK